MNRILNCACRLIVGVTLALVPGIAIGAGVAVPKAEGEIVLFRNGDVLKGSMHGFDSTRGLLWKRPDISRPIALSRTNLANVFLRRTLSPQASTNDCRIVFANGDEFTGNMKKLTDQAVTVSTAFGGELTVPRRQIASVYFSNYPGKLVFDGPRGEEGWTHGEMNAAQGAVRNQWFFNNGAFVSTDASSIARDVKMPFESIIEFDLAWNGAYMLALGLYTDSLQPISLNQRDKEPAFQPFYSLQMNTYSALMMVVPKDGALRQLGSVSLNIPPGSTNAHFTVLSSRTNKFVLLLANGQPVHQWTDPAGWNGLGTGIRLVHQGAGAVRLSNLQIFEWDGKSKPAPLISNLPQLDLVKLVDNQVLAGKILGCDGTNFTINASGRDVTVQMNRVTEWRFATSAQIKTPVGPNDVRLHFQRRGRMTLQLVEWKEKEVVVLSPPFGRVSFSPDAFSRINFHPR